MVPGVVQLRDEEDLAAGHSRVLYALADFLLVAVGQRSVDVAVAPFERYLDRFADLGRP